MVGMLIDQHMNHGAPLGFFGVEALTALSAAELALKYDAAAGADLWRAAARWSWV
jgi:Kdo2-lipid IVA lauroyltransferase/acyltransferase